jgi:6-phosphogluconate dehydrogenase/gluconokinase
MIIIVCGVSGTGKSTVGELLADRLDLPFYDADDFHPDANVDKMTSGIALNDQDRQPWLESLSAHLAKWENEGKGAVLACSALKESYRITLASNCRTNIEWVILNGSRELLVSRLGSREGHFFDANLLDSQLATLELPDYGWTLDVQLSPQEIVNKVAQQLKKT